MCGGRPTRRGPPGGRLRSMWTIDSPPSVEPSVHVVPGRKGSWSVRTDVDARRAEDGRAMATAAVDLYWIPLGAGGRSVRFNGRVYEGVAAAVARRPRSDLYHSALLMVRRKIFAQVAMVLDAAGQPATIVAMRPDPDERAALIAVGHPYFSRGPWDERLGRIAVVVEPTTDWDEIAELVTDSYRLTAPKKLVARLDAADARSGNE